MNFDFLHIDNTSMFQFGLGHARDPPRKHKKVDSLPRNGRAPVL